MLTKFISSALWVLAISVQAAAAEEITLRVDATPSIFKSMFDAFATDFERDNPDIKVRINASFRSQEDIVQATLRQAVVNDLPDVSFQGYNFLRTIVERDIPVPLDDFIASDPEWTAETFSPSVVGSTKIDGQIQGIGVGFSVPVLYYNADLVRQASGDAPFPKTWDEIIKLAKKIEGSNERVVGGFYRTDALFFQAQLNSRGTGYMDSKETVILPDNDAAQSAFALIKSIGEAGQAKVPMQREQARQAFTSGTVGMLSDMSSQIASFKKQIAGNFELGVARFPIPAASGRIPAAGIAAIMSTKDPVRQKAAWKFLKYLARVNGQEILARETSYMPTNEVVVEQSKTLKAQIDAEPLLSPVLESAPYATSWYAFPGANAAKIDVTIGDIVERVSTLKLDPEAAVQELRKKVGQMLPNK